MIDNVNPFQAPVADIEPVTPDETPAEAMRRRYLKHEAWVRSASLFLIAPAGAFAIYPVVWFGGALAEGTLDVALFVVMTVVAWPTAAALLTLGVGLRRLWPWVPIPVAVVSAVGSLLFLPAIPICVFIVYVVYCPAGRMVFSSQHRGVIAQTPHIKYRTSWLVLALLLILVGLLGLSLLYTLFVDLARM